MSIPLLALAAMAGTGPSVGGEPIAIAASKREPMPIASVPVTPGPRQGRGTIASKAPPQPAPPGLAMSAGEIAGNYAVLAMAAAMALAIPYCLVIWFEPPWWDRMTRRAAVALCSVSIIAWPISIAVFVAWLVWVVARNIVGAFRELWRAFFPRRERAGLPRAEVRK